MERAAKRRSHLRIGRRARRGGVDRARERRRCQTMQDEPNQVVAMDPAHPLATVPDPPAEAEFEWQQQTREEPAVAIEHQPGAQAHYAHPERLGALRLPFPGDAEAAGEALA